MKLKPLVVALVAMQMGTLAGCSAFSNALNLEDSRWSKNNYREQEAELAAELEVPPTLIAPSQNADLAILNDGREAQLTSGMLPVQMSQKSQRDIPAYQAQGVSVQATLCERWLMLEQVEAEKTWEGVQTFLKGLGYPIQEANRATGIIKTEYVARKEIVPLVDVSPLTALFNKWRPETAEGVLDRFVVHVRVEGETQHAQIRFHHHQVFKVEDEDAAVYRIKPYDPVKELEMLYQAAIFFGAHQQQALSQVRISAHMKEIVQGEELDGLILHVPLSQAWAYMQSMVWRADWQVDQVVPERHQMRVRLSSQENSKGFFERLAFWREQEKLPDMVILMLKPVEGVPQQTLLQLDVPEGATPLTAEEKKKVFAQLGLLGE